MKKSLFIAFVFILIITLGILILSNAPSDNPYTAIKKYVVQKGHPIQALSLEIEDKKRIDETYGQAFHVEGYKSGWAEVRFFYLKENEAGWFVTSAGTGP